MGNLKNLSNSGMHQIYLITGGSGASGEQLINTVLAQFPEGNVRLTIHPHIRSQDQIDLVLTEARQDHATLVHTMVDPNLRSYLRERCAREGIYAIDLMGELFDRLESELGQRSLGQPGLYRLLNKAYFERVGAIEYAMAHDDGKDPGTWALADLLLVGVSRVGKTPLSLYLSVMGWKVANQPLVSGVELPAELFHLDPHRVIGLTMEPGQLLALRQERQRRMGSIGQGSYTHPESVYEEIEFARRLCRRSGFTLIDVTDKPLETTADQVIRLITNRFTSKGRPG
jgi:[pyruvate, water dikinase]-phosphate phosphotransferase / [pyruvate, water dikinase] kinase